MRVYAGIVTYNADIERLAENVCAVLPQVERVIVFDNGSDNVDDIAYLLEGGRDHVTLLRSKENKGMAKALNVLCRTAKDEGADNMLLLDQDSVVAPGFVSILANYIDEGRGLIVPLFQDRNEVVEREMEHEYEEVSMAITSGALSNLRAWEDVGGYDENLFVDWVDYEYCDALLLHGYKILKVRDAELIHEIGKKEYKRMCWTFSIHRGFFRCPLYQTDRPFIRRYDIMRAHKYVSMKYRGTSLGKHEEWMLVYDILRNLVRERKRGQFVHAASKGIVDGWRLAKRAHAHGGKAKLVDK